MWESKMCRLAWQLLGMLGNVLGLLGMLCNILGMLCNVLGLLGMPFHNVLGVPHRRKNPPTCCLISCETKGVVYHQTSIYMKLGGTLLPWLHSFNVGLLGPCENACRGGRGCCKHAQDVAKHAQDVTKHAEEAEDVAKHAQELPSKPTHLRFPHQENSISPPLNDVRNLFFIRYPESTRQYFPTNENIIILVISPQQYSNI